MRNIVFTSVVAAAFWALCAGHAAAEPVLTFEGLQNLEQVDEYYNGGLGSLGSGPGPNDGITFSANALALVRMTPFPGDPSPPTVLLLGNTGLGAGQPLTMTMDVSGGFSTGLIFYDIAIGRPATVNIYSGPDGTGTMLATYSPPLQSPSNEAFAGAVVESFSGVAHSVVFAGGNLQLVFDDISFASVPEPSGWFSLAVGLVSSWIGSSRWRRRTVTGSRST